MKKYKSKVGWGLVAFISIILGIEAVIFTYNRIWNGLILLFFITLLIVYAFLSIYYLVVGNELIVKSAFGMKVIVPIDSITKIKETKNLISSPAASLDRIEISYGKKAVIISPQNKKEFISQLIALNPKIEVIYKTK